jgi:hypothetical protein
MTSVKPATVLIAANTSWYLYNFRLRLMKELAAAGHRVVALAPPDHYTARLAEHGFETVSYPVSRRGPTPSLN